jgi:hypothetical protein
MAIRKMDVRPAARTIPDLLKSDQGVGEVTVVYKPLPFTPWSDGKSIPIACADMTDPVLRKAGWANVDSVCEIKTDFILAS